MDLFLICIVLTYRSTVVTGPDTKWSRRLWVGSSRDRDGILDGESWREETELNKEQLTIQK